MVAVLSAIPMIPSTQPPNANFGLPAFFCASAAPDTASMPAMTSAVVIMSCFFMFSSPNLCIDGEETNDEAERRHTNGVRFIDVIMQTKFNFLYWFTQFREQHSIPVDYTKAREYCLISWWQIGPSGQARCDARASGEWHGHPAK